jgi:hypothetical protein
MPNVPTDAGLSGSTQPDFATSTPGANSGSTTATSKSAKGDGAVNSSLLAQGTSTSGLQPQHLQSGTAQNPAVEATTADAGGMQTMVTSPHAEPRTLTGTSTSSGTAEAATHAANSSDDEDQELATGMGSAGISGISAARLIQTIGSSEMRMGMHSSEFGNISIRTSVSQQQIFAQISVDHNELGNALSTHIHSVQSRLGSEYGLNANIQLNQSGASSSGERGGSQQQPSRPTEGQARTSETPAAQSDLVIPAIATVAGSQYRLDIRA